MPPSDLTISPTGAVNLKATRGVGSPSAPFRGVPPLGGLQSYRFGA